MLLYTACRKRPRANLYERAGRMHIEIESRDSIEQGLTALLRDEPDLPYANFRPMRQRRKGLVRMHHRRWSDDSDSPGFIAARDASGSLVGALRLSHRRFESEHFGMSMARIELPLAPRDRRARIRVLREMYDAAHGYLGERGYDHVAARCSTRDAESSWVLQEQRAVHVNTQVSWMCETGKDSRREELPRGLYYEEHDADTIRAIDPVAWRRIDEWAGHAFDQGPFSRDMTMPRERSLAVYQEWTRQVMSGEWADSISVVRNRDEIVAFIALLEIPDLSEACGELVLGRGLGATLPEHQGLFTAIQRQMITRMPSGAAFIENETQASTVGSINVYAKLGFRYLRSTETFHRSLS